MTKQASRRYRFGPFQLDVAEQILFRDGQAIPLKPKVFDLLVVLVENGGRVVRKEELMKRLWPESFVEDSNLAVTICELRKTLGDGRTGHSSFIETVPRRGYRFVPRVSDESGEAADAAVSHSSLVVASNGDGRVREGTLAVLPFKSIGATGEEYLGLGMADALITRLSNLRQITVRPTSSVRKYDGSQDPVEAGRELRVEWVLDGSVQRSGKRMRATVQLVNVSDGASNWAGKFDDEFNGIFGVEDSISEQVVSAVTLKLSGKERTLLAKRYTDNTKAYQACLKGRYFFNKGTPEALKKAITQFELAIAADPSYAHAYSGLADCHNVRIGQTWVSRQEAGPKATEAALKAVELDDSLAEAHASLAFVRMRDWNWPGAESEFKLALDLNPGCSTAHDWYVLLLRITGRNDEALGMMKRAQKGNPLSLTTNVTLGSALCIARKYDEAIEQLLGTLDLDANFGTAIYYLALSYEGQGRYEEALAEYQRQIRLEGGDAELLACVGRIYAVTGRRGAALKMIDRLKSRSSRVVRLHPYLIALIYAALGETEEAFRWLERAYAEHDVDLPALAADPRMDCLNADPRYVSLLERMGLANSANRETAEAASGGWLS